MSLCCVPMRARFAAPTHHTRHTSPAPPQAAEKRKRRAASMASKIDRRAHETAESTLVTAAATLEENEKLMKELMSDAAEDFAPEWTEVCESFDDMGLHENLLRGIYAYGFEKPSAIQQRAVVPIIKGRDVIAQAQSGTGKTSMISLAVCQNIKTETRE